MHLSKQNINPANVFSDQVNNIIQNAQKCKKECIKNIILSINIQLIIIETISSNTHNNNMINLVTRQCFPFNLFIFFEKMPLLLFVFYIYDFLQFFLYLKVYFYLYTFFYMLNLQLFLFIIIFSLDILIYLLLLMKLETKNTKNQEADNQISSNPQNIQKTQPIIKKCKKIEKIQKSTNSNSTQKRKGPRLQVIQKNITQKKYIGRPKAAKRASEFKNKKQLEENYFISLMCKQVASNIRNQHFIHFFFLIKKNNGLVFTKVQRKKLNRKKTKKIYWSDKPQSKKQTELIKIKRELSSLKPQNDKEFQKLPFHEKLKEALSYIFYFTGQIFCEQTTEQLYKILKEIFLISWQNSAQNEQLKKKLISYGHKIGSNANHQYKFISFDFHHLDQFRLQKQVNKDQIHHIWLVQKISNEFGELIQFFKKQKYLPRQRKQQKKEEITMRIQHEIELENVEDVGRFLNYNSHDQFMMSNHINDFSYREEPMRINRDEKQYEYQSQEQIYQQDESIEYCYEGSQVMRFLNGNTYHEEEQDQDILGQKVI